MLKRTLHHTCLTILSLLLTGSWMTATASQPAQLPCAVWSSTQSTLCMRAQVLTLPSQSMPTLLSASNLAVDQAMGSLKNDISIVPPALDTQSPKVQVALRQNQVAVIHTKIKNNTAKARAIPTAAVKPRLTRSQIVQQELQREKAALRAAENQLNQAKKSGKNIQKLERQVSDRRASISAMQSELARL